MSRNDAHTSLDKKLRRLLWSMLLLVCVILVATLAILLLHNHQYSIVTANIVRASQFNQNFKEDVDLKMYYYVIDSSYGETLPLQEVDEALTLAQELLDGTQDRQSRKAITSAIDLREEESGNQYKSMLKRALRYIDQNYTDENLSLNSVAKAANISPNYFSGVFSQEMGQTFVEYLTEKRMERAKELLRYSGKRSSEVAYEVGYRDPRYFSFLFKKMQGCTPSSYRAGNGEPHEQK